MNIIKTVRVYETDDGRLFRTEDEAVEHTTKTTMLELLNNKDQIMGSYQGSFADPVDVLRWLDDHRELVMSYLRITKQ